MRPTFTYPLDVPELLRKRRALKEQLLEQGPLIEKRIAVLGGSTTTDVTSFLELFLLSAGIQPRFFESGYNRFFEAGLDGDGALEAFAPDVVVVHTTHHNIAAWPRPLATEGQVDALFLAELDRFGALWKRLLEKTQAVVVQNNFDPPQLEALGHLGGSAPYGRTRYLRRLNAAFAEAAGREPRLRINDIAALAAQVGLSEWSTPSYWFNFKMAVTPAAAVRLAHQTAKIIRAAFGRTRKCLVLDLDNTLWGGVIGDDGLEGLKLGNDHPEGEAYSAFQRWCLELKERGVLLAVCSKNDPEVARRGFEHPDSVLRLSDFSAFVASWEPKPQGLEAIARKLNLPLDSLVFVDDNPFERDLVMKALPQVAVVNASSVTRFPEVLEREGHFEPFSLTQDDGRRAEQYAAESQRVEAQSGFTNYIDYLKALQMKAHISRFEDVYLERITQLVNKTNQFNLTTQRLTFAEVQALAKSPEHIALYGRLLDRFGDNGLVSVVVGHVLGEQLHLDLWLMSCRVLGRSMEVAMFEALCDEARARGLKVLIGRYLPTEKNALVAQHYLRLGFTQIERTGTFRYELDTSEPPPHPPIERS